MSFLVSLSQDHIIALPTALMARLHLQEGDRVTALLEGQTLQFLRLDHFESELEEEPDEDTLDETAYLLSSSANAARLQQAKQQIAAGQLIEIVHVDDLDQLLT
jgi:hypothetical protein